jgi:adenylate cyclase class 2
VAVEREIKLRFQSVEAARQLILSPAIGGAPLRSRRLQQDALLDTEDRSLSQRGSAIRVRNEAGSSVLTFKGPVQPGQMKVREEYETAVDDGAALLKILARLGLQVWFRYEKHREEFTAPGVVIAIDETPIGVFVELEGSEAEITRAATALGKTSQDYLTASYRALFLADCQARGCEATDMLFAPGASRARE